MSHREGASSTTELVNSASDAVFGTRSYTPGARLQLPRKVPLRVEPKSFFGETPVCQAPAPEVYTTVYDVDPFANERTFLGWLSMATTVGGISTALAGYTNAVEKKTSGTRTISENTSQLITIILLPVAIVMIAYAMTTYFFRSKYMQKKQMGFYQDWYGPAIMAGLIMLSLLAIMGLAIVDLVQAGF